MGGMVTGGVSNWFSQYYKLCSVVDAMNVTLLHFYRVLLGAGCWDPLPHFRVSSGANNLYMRRSEFCVWNQHITVRVIVRWRCAIVLIALNASYWPICYSFWELVLLNFLVSDIQCCACIWRAAAGSTLVADPYYTAIPEVPQLVNTPSIYDVDDSAAAAGEQSAILPFFIVLNMCCTALQ